MTILNRTENTSRATDIDGAFGLPWMVATNLRGETDRFWGCDRLSLMARHLGLLDEEKTGGTEEGRELRALL